VTIEGEPVCHEHTALLWGQLTELAQLPLAPSDRRFVESRLELIAPAAMNECGPIAG
jgi:hypothetical protein